MEILENCVEKADDMLTEGVMFAQERPMGAALAVIGTAYVASKAYRAVKFMYKSWLRTSYDLHKRYAGGWALVTGASSGIGAAICKELGRRGFNIIMMARRVQNMETLVQEIKTANPTKNLEFEVIQFDFDKPFSELEYKKVIEVVDKREVSILVNNAGTATAMYFERMTFEEISRQIYVNLVSMSFLSRIVAERMLKRKHKSAILNIGSVANEGDWPYVSVYGATKAYMNALTTSISLEYKGRIDVTCVNPRRVTTELNPRGGVFAISSDKAARCYLDRLGKMGPTDGGHWKHELQLG
ncbi:MAG: SDR family NAD(P)-dependent oxidoreductase [Planctomycetes bacterium]|nr:SDR family NAD(P)-dependent oxidoreductase [Planctomycetota bacterium]